MQEGRLAGWRAVRNVRSGRNMQARRRSAPCACRAAVTNLRAAISRQAMAKALSCATQHGASCGVQLGGRSGELGRRGAGREGTGHAVETVCAAVHHWSPAHGGVGLASGGSAPESDGCKCAEESVSLA